MTKIVCHDHENFTILRELCTWLAPYGVYAFVLMGVGYLITGTTLILIIALSFFAGFMILSMIPWCLDDYLERKIEKTSSSPLVIPYSCADVDFIKTLDIDQIYIHRFYTNYTGSSYIEFSSTDDAVLYKLSKE